MKNRIELGKLKNEIRVFIVILLVILYAMDFVVLANIILASTILTKIVNYIFERLGV